jgi:NAD(P)-dependent dehydrogenase (short-subunit alcohol dehydrogenase family)
MGRFEGKLALVTGASKPTGIGCAIALKLASEGASVAVTDLCEQLEGYPGYPRMGSNDELTALADKIAGLGVKSLAIPLDVTSPASVAAMADRVAAEWGRLDVLVNNAGGSPGPGPVAAMAEEAWLKTLDINLNGTFRVCRALIPLLAKSGPGGAIVNLSSRAGKNPAAFMSAYCTAKAGVIMLTKVLALELAGQGTRVNCICPGQIQTELGEWGWRMRAFSKGQTLETYLGEIKKEIPLGRVGTPEDCANVVAWLASAEADYLTGQAVNVTGGQLMVL